MRTARSSSHRGGVSTRHPLGPDPPLGSDPPGTRPPMTRHPRSPGPGTPLWPGTPPVDRHTPVNILPCPKLCLRAVTMVTKHKCKEWVLFQFSNVNVPFDTVLKFDTSANATLRLTLSLNWPFLVKVNQFCTSRCLSRITLTTAVTIASLKPKYHQWFVFNCAGLVNEDTDVTASLWGSRYEWTGKSRRFISKWNYYSNSSFKLCFSRRKRFDIFAVRKT